MPNNRWIHNFGQSIKYSAHDALKDIAPTITQTVTDATADLRGMRNTLKYAKRRKELLNNYLTGDNPELIDQVDKARNNVKKSFKTGKFYETEDEKNTSMAEMLGGEDAKFMLGMLDNFDDDFEEENPELEDADESTTIISKELGNTSKKIGLSTMQAAYTTNKAIRGQTSTISSGFMVANNAINTLSANVVSVVEIAAKEHSELLTGITNKIDTINTFNNDSISPFFQASINYYNDSLSIFREMNESIKTLTGANNIPESKKSYYNNNLMNLINGEEGFKLSNIAKFGALNLRKKANDATMGAGEMLPLMFAMVGENPMSWILTEGMKSMIPKKISDATKSLDKSFKSFIPSLFSKLNDYSGDNPLVSLLSGVFGIDITRGKRKLDLSGYNKGTIPFDGITKKAIVEVIPTYLSKILQSLQGSKETYLYDYDKGKFTTLNKSEHRFKKRASEARVSGSYDMMSEVEDYLYKKNIGGENRKTIIKNIKNMINNAVKTGSSINYKDKNTYTGVDKDFKDIIENILTNALSYGSQSDLLYNIQESGASSYHGWMDRVLDNEGVAFHNGVANMNGKVGNRQYSNNGTNTKKAKAKSAKAKKRNSFIKNSVSAKKKEKASPEQLLAMLQTESGQNALGLDIPLGITEEESANGKDGFMNTVSRYMNQPVEFVGDLIRGLDTSLHAILFGKKGSVFQNIVKGIQNTFLNTFSWIRDRVLVPFKEGVFGKNIKDSKIYKGISSFILGEKDKDGNYTGGLLSGLRNEASMIWDETKKAWTDNVVPIISEAGNLLADYIAPSPKDENGKEGKRVPLIDRLYDGLSTGFSNFMGAMFGSNNSKFDTKKFTSVSLKELRAKLPKSLAIGGLGAGLGIANGLGAFGLLGQMFLPGGPLGGLIVGSVVGFATQSNRIKDYLFGKETTQSDGTKKRSGGFISSGVQDWFKENKVPIVGGALFGMAKAAIFGGGLVPGVAMAAFGPAIMGAAYGLAKKSKYIQDILFGHDVTLDDGTTKKVGGIFSKVSNLQLSKVLPNIGAGALLGMGASSVVGSMGLVGSMIALGPIPSAIMGAGMGLAISSKKLTRRLFGFMDNKGKYHAGIFDRAGNAINLELIRPFKLWSKRAFNDIRHWFAMSVGIPLRAAFYPLKVAITDIGRGIKGAFKKSFGRIFTGINGLIKLMFGKTSNMFNLMARGIGSLLSGAVYKTAKIASLPISLGVKGVSALSGLGTFHIRNKARKEAIEASRQEAENATTFGGYAKAKFKQYANHFNFNNTDSEEVNILNAEKKKENEDRLAENRRYNGQDWEYDKQKRELRADQDAGSTRNYANTAEQDQSAADRIKARMKDAGDLFDISKNDTPATAAAKASAQYNKVTADSVTNIANDVKAIKNEPVSEKVNRVFGLQNGKGNTAEKNKIYGILGMLKPGDDSATNEAVGDRTYAEKKKEEEEKKPANTLVRMANATEDIAKHNVGKNKTFLTCMKYITSGFSNLLGFFLKIVSLVPVVATIGGTLVFIAGLIKKFFEKDENGERGGAKNVLNAGIKELGGHHVRHLGEGFVKKGALPKIANIGRGIYTGVKNIKAAGFKNFIVHPMKTLRGGFIKSQKVFGLANGKTVGLGTKLAVGAKKIGNKIVSHADTLFTKVKALLSKSEFMEKAINKFTNLSAVKKLLGKKVSKFTTPILKIIKGVVGSSKFLTSIGKMIKTYGSKFVARILGTVGGYAGFIAGGVAGGTAGGVAGMGAGAVPGAAAGAAAGGALSNLAVGVGYGIYDAATGWTDAPYLFNQDESSITWRQKEIASLVNVFWGWTAGYPIWCVDMALQFGEIGIGFLCRGEDIERGANLFGINIDDIDHRRATALLMFELSADDDEKSKQKAESDKLNAEYNDYAKKAAENGEEVMKRETWMEKTKKSGGGFWGRIGHSIMHPIDTIKGWLGFGDKKKEGFAGGGIADKALVAKDAASQTIVNGFNNLSDSLNTAFSYIKKGIADFIKSKTSPFRFALSMFGFDMTLDKDEKKNVTNMQNGIAGLMNWVGAKFFQISEGFGNFINNGVQLMQDIAKALADKANEAVDNAVSVVTHPVDTAKKWASSAWKGIKNFFGFKGAGKSFAGAGRSVRPMGTPKLSRPLGRHAFVGGAADSSTLQVPKFNMGNYTGKLASIASNIGNAVNSGMNPLQLVSDILHNRPIGGDNSSSSSSSSGSSDKVNSGNLEGNAKRVYEFLRQHGYSNSAAAGIMGNLQQEHNFDPSDVGEHVGADGSTYGGLGIVQWNGGRTQALRQYASEQGKDPEDLELQLEYMIKEINDSYEDVKPDKMNDMTAAEAAAHWNKIYEVGTHTDYRENYANKIYDKINTGEFGGQGILKKFTGGRGILDWLHGLQDPKAPTAQTGEGNLLSGVSSPDVLDDTKNSDGSVSDEFRGEPNVRNHATGKYGLGTKNFSSFGDWIAPVGYYRQDDPFWNKWGFAHKLATDTKKNFGTLGDNGCGVLSLANSLIYGEDGLSDEKANPLVINDMLTEGDIDDNGSTSSLVSDMTDSNVFSRIGDNLGKNIEPYRGTLAEFKGQLAAGSSFILGGKSSEAPFSNRGHYVFATGLGERQVTDADGNNPHRVPATAVVDPAGMMTGVYPLEDLMKVSIDKSSNMNPLDQKTPGVAYVVSPKIKDTWYRRLVGGAGGKNGKNGKGKNGADKQESGGMRGLSFLYAYAKAAASEYINCITEGRGFKAPKYRKLKDGSFVLDDDKKNAKKLSKTKDTEIDTSNTNAKFEKDGSGIITGPTNFKGYKGQGNYSFVPVGYTTKEGTSQEALEFLNAISDEWYAKYNQKLTVTSMKRYDTGGSEHNDGHAFDVSDEMFENDPARREDYMKMAFNLGGRQIIDEYSSDWTNVMPEEDGRFNIHVSTRSPFFEGGGLKFLGGSVLPMIANRVPNSGKALGSMPFSGGGFGFGRMGNAYNNNIAGLLGSFITRMVAQKRTKINDKAAERNAFLAMITKGFRGTDRNDDAWNDLLAGDSGLTSALGIKPSESDARNIGKKPSLWDQIMNRTFGHPLQNEKGKRTNILIAKPAGHAIDWEAKAKIMNNAYAEALNRQAAGMPEYNDLVMSRIKAIVDATQTRANNMSPADKAAVAELRKKGPALVAKAADASITWVKIKVGDKVGFVSKQYIQLDPNTKTGVITGDDVNFREQPTLSSKVIKMLAKGTKVDYEPGDVASIATDANGKPIKNGAVDESQNMYELFNIQLKQKLGVALSKDEEALLNGDSSALNKIFDNGTSGGALGKTDKILKATSMHVTNTKAAPNSIKTKADILKNDITKVLSNNGISFAKITKETTKAVRPDSAIGTANTIKSMTNAMPSMTSESVLANAIRSLDVHDELHTIIKYLGNMSGNGNGGVYVIDPRTGKKTIVDTKRENTKRNNGPLLDKIQAMGDTSAKDDSKALSMLQDAIAIAKGGTFRTVKA